MIDLALANAVVAFASLVQAASGIGFAMIAVPLLALIDLDYVPGPSLLAMLGLSMIMALRGWKDVDHRGLFVLLPGLAAGTIAGALALGALPRSAMGLLFGGMILIALALGRTGLAPGRTGSAFALSGVIAGLMGTMAGIHGPALAVLYQSVAVSTAKATIALIFVIASSLSLFSLYIGRLFDQADILTGLALWPGVLVGYGLVIGIGSYISDNLARRIMLGLAACCALLLIAKSLWPTS